MPKRIEVSTPGYGWSAMYYACPCRETSSEEKGRNVRISLDRWEGTVTSVAHYALAIVEEWYMCVLTLCMQP